jgi:acyl carrier protein
MEKSKGEINSIASYVTTRVDEFIKSGSRPLPLVFGAEVFVNTDSVFKTYSESCRIQILLWLLDDLENIPEVEKIQVYHAKIYYESMHSVKFDDLPKDFITDIVLSLTQKFPKVGKYKVTEETHFFKDLGFDKWDHIDIIQALQVRFKLYIPYEIVSCKLAIEYIYDHLMESLPFEEFRKCFFVTGEFGESKSEFRRIFLPGDERRKNGIKSDLDCRALSCNGFKPYEYFKNMKLPFYTI